MAIYHTRVKTFSRANGHSSTAAAAYRAGLRLADEATGVCHDYRRRGGVVETRCFAPLESPLWALEPAELWRAAEASERRRDSTVCREFEVSLPHEFTDEQRSELVGDLSRELVGRYGFAVQSSIHEPGTEDGLNHHVHILATTRRMRPEGLKDKTRELDGGPSGKAEIEWIREMVADRINDHLARAAIEDRVDHRSLKAQAEGALSRGDVLAAAMLAREPTEHVGKDATALHRRGVVCQRMETNEAIADGNEESFQRLLSQFEKEGRLVPIPEGHSHVRAQEDAQANTGERARGAVMPGMTPTLFVPPRRRRTLAANAQGDAGTDPQLAREEEVRRVMIEAASLWLEDFASNIQSSFVATNKFLCHHAERVAQFAHSAVFRIDVSQLLLYLKQLKHDVLRFERRMKAEDHAAHLLGQAEHDLARFDAQHPKPALWTKREWAKRRERRALTVQARHEEHRAARQQTGPEAQSHYNQRVQSSARNLEILSQSMLKHFPVDADVEPIEPPDAPVDEPAKDANAVTHVARLN